MKIKPKNTPGPWSIEETEDTIFILPKSGETVCQIEKANPLFGSENPHQADARLIASAPEILSLLLEIHAVLKSGMPLHPGTIVLSENDDTALELIGAAIVKATGGE